MAAAQLIACDVFPLSQDYQRLLASQPSRRLNPAKLAETAAFKTKLVEAIAFMESLAVKDSAEKDLFFKRLPTVIPTLPLPVAQRKVCVALARPEPPGTRLFPAKGAEEKT